MAAGRHLGGGCEVPVFSFYVLSLCVWEVILLAVQLQNGTSKSR
jgi:hypothetical protein